MCCSIKTLLILSIIATIVGGLFVLIPYLIFHFNHQNQDFKSSLIDAKRQLDNNKQPSNTYLITNILYFIFISNSTQV